MVEKRTRRKLFPPIIDPTIDLTLDAPESMPAVHSPALWTIASGHTVDGIDAELVTRLRRAYLTSSQLARLHEMERAREGPPPLIDPGFQKRMTVEFHAYAQMVGVICIIPASVTELEPQEAMYAIWAALDGGGSEALSRRLKSWRANIEAGLPAGDSAQAASNARSIRCRK